MGMMDSDVPYRVRLPAGEGGVGFILSRSLSPAQRSVWAAGVGQGKPCLVVGET